MHTFVRVATVVDDNSQRAEHSDCVEEAHSMSEHLTTQQSEDPGNPYAAPTVDMSDPWSHGPPEALALRRANRRDESYVNGLAITNFAYALFFGFAAFQEISILISHVAGQINAPSIVRPARFTTLVVTVCMPIAAFGAAWGFLRRKRWALRWELALAALWCALFALEPLIRSRPRPLLELLGLAAGNLMLAAPMLSAWYLRRSVVFDAEYSNAIAETRHIWFWPKVSAKLVLVTFVLFGVACVLIGVSQHH
jgi:hypothetical protein